MSKNRPGKEIDATPLFPPASDRTAWLAVLKKPHSRKIARELVRTAREVLTQPIPALPASLFMEFVRNGDRSHYQAPYFARRANLNALVMAEVIEYKGKYLDGIIDYLWEITAEHSWCLPAHFHLKDDPFPEPPADVVDLFAAETGMTLSQVLNLLEPELKAVSPNLVKTVRENLSRRVVEPILRKPFPFWWLVGISNWTPWCCSECLATALCVLKDQPARLRKAVAVLQKGIDAFIRQYSADGFGVEGPVYWSKSPGMLLSYMEQLRWWSDSPKIRPMAEYIAYACLTPNYYAAFGDTPPVIKPPQANSRSPQFPVSPAVCCRFGERTGNSSLTALGFEAAADLPVKNLLGDLFRLQAFFFWVPGRRGGTVKKKTVNFYPESQALFLNEAGIALAAKRGGQCPHHHSDVGQVILFFRNRPVLIDLGRTEYRRETFNNHRFENWRLNAEGHNIPQFNGIRQLDAVPLEKHVMSVSEDRDRVICRMDLSHAYPNAAGVKSCIRELVWNRKEKTLEIHDSWELKKRSGNTIRIPYYTVGRAVCRSGKLQINGVNVRLEKCSAAVTDVPLEDPMQILSWGKTVKRIDVTAKSSSKGECSLIFEFK